MDSPDLGDLWPCELSASVDEQETLEHATYNTEPDAKPKD